MESGKTPLAAFHFALYIEENECLLFQAQGSSACGARMSASR